MIQTSSKIHFKNTDFENIYDCSGIKFSNQSDVVSQKENFVEKIQTFIEKERGTILSSSPLMTKALDEYSVDPDSLYGIQLSHYVVLTSIKKAEDDFLLLTVDTYGKQFNIKISRDDFFKHCFGTIEYELIPAPDQTSESKVACEAAEPYVVVHLEPSSPLLQFSNSLVPKVIDATTVTVAPDEIARTAVNTNNEVASRAVFKNG